MGPHTPQYLLPSLASWIQAAPPRVHAQRARPLDEAALDAGAGAKMRRRTVKPPIEVQARILDSDDAHNAISLIHTWASRSLSKPR